MTRAAVTDVDPFTAARRVADAVLYEGYVLYPYRASSGKNRNRWQFGVLVPPSATNHGAWGEAATVEGATGGSEAHTEFLVDGVGSELRVLIRLLQVQTRVVEVPADDGTWRAVASTTVDGRTWTSWDEAVEHEVDLGWVSLDTLRTERLRVPLDFGDRHEVESLLGATGVAAGRLVRRREALSGEVRVGAAMCDQPCPLVRLRIEIENDTPWDAQGTGGWDETTRHALVAVHAAGGGARRAVRVAAWTRRNSPVRRWPPVRIGASTRCWRATRAPTTWCWPRPSSSTTTPSWPPRARATIFDATEIDEILDLAGPHPDRRGEGRGPCHRPPGRGDHRPL